MDLNRKIARMLIVGTREMGVTDALGEMIDRGVGGVVFFTRNISSPGQLNAFAGELKRRAEREGGGGRRGRLLTCIDHEGGRVMRCREGFTAMPSMRRLGLASVKTAERAAGMAAGGMDDTALARRVGEIFAAELRAVNVDVNFAPVMDVDTNPDNPVIGDRSFGSSPQVVARLGNALIEGMQANGVAACAKHFPGHGDTAMDSHLDLPHLPHDMARLEAVELAPFAAAVANNVAAVMSAHVLFDALDDEYPATMSRVVLDGILRKKMGFKGVVFSDCLQMKAIADHYGIEQAVVRGANAGVDAFLVCHDVEVQLQAMDALAAAVKRGEVPRERIEQANARLDRLCDKYCRPPVEWDPSQLGTEEAMAVVREIERLGGAEGGGEDPTEKPE